MKVYDEPPAEVQATIERLIKKYHPDLVKRKVKVIALFVADDKDPEAPAVMHHGFPALAVVGSVPAKYRALGVADAVIEIDRTRFLKATPKRQESLLAHEIYHLVVDKEGIDGADRPKLKMRKHDHQFGWFTAIAKRYGEDSHEVIQARTIVSEAGQIYFGFAQQGEVVPITRAELQKQAATGE